MNHIEALLLGIIQGLTEFIPISSTAHLTIAAAIMGVIDPNNPQQWTAFMATIQLGTLGALLWYFRKDIVVTSAAFFKENVGSSRKSIRQQTPEARMGWYVLIGTIPIVVIGLLFKDVIEGTLTKNLYIIGFALIAVGGLLLWADRTASLHRTLGDVKAVDAIRVGFAQVLALIPGSSRSGTTIMAALFIGFNREAAARFSFLLSIPAIFGAGVVQFAKEMPNITWADGGSAILIATIASAISGYWSIAFLLDYLRRNSVAVFVWYRIIIGFAVLVLHAFGKI